MDLLADLTSEQRAAVTHVEGPLLVLAGAGSGKTRVITRRVAHLLEQGVSPRNILAVTFTNKAAGEMAERITRLVPHSGTRSQPVWVTTFHKFCARMLRMYGEHVGLHDGYVIYDTSDRLKVVKDALEKAGIDKTRLPPDRVDHTISRAKNDLLDPAAYTDRANDYFELSVAQVYRIYQEQLLQANAVDFDDLLLHVATMLRDQPERRAQLDERYRFILVDEYQDTNLAQYAILRALSTDHPNLCVTGDPDQSIYGWRGANLNNILKFEDDFPGTRVVRLEQNYRSTKRILAAASHLIRFNQRRKHKELFTDNPEGRAVRVTAYADESDEARSIAIRMREAVESSDRSYSDFAVFCRVAALTRTLEMAFAAEQVPYQVLSGVAFYERAEVKDLLAYLKLLVNPRDDVSFARVVNVPARGIGKGTLERIHELAAGHGLSLLETARRLTAEQSAISIQRSAISDQLLTTHHSPLTTHQIKPRQLESLGKFVQLIDELTALRGHCVAEIMRQVLARTKYFKEHLGTSEDDERRANVEELISAAHQFDVANPDGDLTHFLSESVLATDLDGWDPSRPAVSLMTLHAAKGLEFPVVYIIAVEHGILPHQRAIEDANDDLEEERRLLFVGMTRAKEELCLSYVCTRDYRGQSRLAIPSRFLGELDAATREYEESARMPRPERKPIAAGAGLVTAAELAGESPRPAASRDSFHEGMLVRHPQFGLGRITTLSGMGAMRKATVRFTTGDTRTFVVAKASLRPVKVGQGA